MDAQNSASSHMQQQKPNEQRTHRPLSWHWVYERTVPYTAVVDYAQ